MRVNLVIGAAVLTLATGLLAGCGGGGGGGSSASGGYCDELKTDKAYFAALSGSDSDASKLGDAFGRIHSLAGDAPANVAADWKTLDGAITTIESALNSAGLTPDDLAGLQSGKVPPGVDLSKLQALAPKLEQLSSSGVSKAADNIAADAKKSCGVDLTAS
jgi:hypothetical protein